MSTFKNLKKATTNLFGAASSTVLVTSELLVDATEFVSNSIGCVPGAIKATVSIPKSTAIGYISEDQQISREEATAKVEEAMPENIGDAITTGAMSLGALMALMLDDSDDTEEETK